LQAIPSGNMITTRDSCGHTGHPEVLVGVIVYYLMFITFHVHVPAARKNTFYFKNQTIEQISDLV